MKDKILEELKELAKDSEPVARARIVAGIVHKNKLMSIGFNSYKTHPLAYYYSKNKDFTVSLHAEVDAIKNFVKQYDSELLQHCKIYVVRMKIIGGEFVPGLAKPCEGCARAIAAFGIPTTYWTEDD